MIDLEDILIAIFERYEKMTNAYEEVCPKDLFDPDAVLTPLEHSIHVLAEELGYDSMELWKTAVTNVRYGKRTSLPPLRRGLE